MPEKGQSTQERKHDIHRLVKALFAAIPLEDWPKWVFRNDINISKVAKEIGCARSSLNENELVQMEFDIKKEELRKLGILASEEEYLLGKNKPGSMPRRDDRGNKQMLANQERAMLENKLAEVLAENAAYKEKLKERGLFNEFLLEHGKLPL
jgi:hypothetical protein